MLSRAACLGAVAAIAAFLAAAPPAQAQRCDTNLRILNNSRSNITRIYFNPSTISSWGPDRLGGQVLRPGQSMMFRLVNEVPHDFRVVWRGNEAAEMRHTNICQINSVVITEDGLRVR